MIPVDTPEIGIDQFAEAVRDGAAIVDVREAGEYVAGHVPGAVLIPMGQLPGRMAEHVKQVMAGAPVSQRCAGHSSDPAASGGWLRELLGRN